jgi:CO/xanthine dehydrogenase FAD-binding subunit
MKPAPFRWHGPRTVAEAVEALAGAGAGGKVLAGGQSLLPLLAMRLAEPTDLVDLNKVAGLDTVTVDGRGVTIGALVRHRALERHAGAFGVQPLLRQALLNVAHPTIRNRGTTVGSLAHADPSGEMTMVLALTGGEVTARSVRGTRTIAATDFFVSALESALEPDEIAVSATFPALPAGARTAFLEIARRHGDYALCGVGAVVESDGGVVRSVRCGYLSVSDTPLVLDVTQAWADGTAAEFAAGAVDPAADLHASADYRRHLAGVLTERAIRAALAQSRGMVHR